MNDDDIYDKIASLDGGDNEKYFRFNLRKRMF